MPTLKYMLAELWLSSPPVHAAFSQEYYGNEGLFPKWHPPRVFLAHRHL